MADETKEFGDAELIPEYTVSREGPDGEPIIQSGKAIVGTANPLGGSYPDQVPSHDIDVFELGSLRGMHEINVLPDWVRIVAGEASFMLAETSVALVTIYEEAERVSSSSGAVVGVSYKRVATLTVDQDAILRSLYPDATFFEDPTFLTLDYNFTGPRDGPDELFPAGHFHDHYTGRYYLQVETFVQDDFVLGELGSYTFTHRYAVGVDLSTGLRASEWGADWVNLEAFTIPQVPEPISTLPPEAALEVVSATPDTLQVESRPWHYDQPSNTWSLPATDILPAADLEEHGEGGGAFVEEVSTQLVDKFVEFVGQLKEQADGAGDDDEEDALQGIHDAIDRVQAFKDVATNYFRKTLGLLEDGISNSGKPGFDDESWHRQADDLAPQVQEEIGDLGEDNLNDATKDKAKGLVEKIVWYLKHSDVSAGALFADGSDPHTFDLADGHSNAAIGGGLNETFNGGDLRDLVAGGGGDDAIYGNGGNDSLSGGSGIDRLYGGLGDDRYVVEDAGDTVTELKDEGTDAVESSVSFSLSGQYVEVLTLTGSANINATGNNQANTLIGNSGNNVLKAGGGNDTLNGGLGADTMIGGLGNDRYIVDNAGDTVTELKNEGTDTVESSVSFNLSGQYVEVLKLTGSSNINATGNNQANTLIGNAGNNVLKAGGGNDTLNGGTGADTMVGGTGDDRYFVDNAGDKVTELKNEGTDTVESSVSFNLSGQYVEVLTLTGSDNIDATGNNQANTLVGNSGSNVLMAGAGDDTLNGGLGADTMIGGSGNDRYIVDNAGDKVTEFKDEGADTVESSVSFNLSGQYVEVLTLTGSGNINATGNNQVNTLIGNAGKNVLTAGGGSDTLNGGAGADTMIGGLGNDRFIVDNAGDTVTELNNEGTDTVESSVSFNLSGQYVEVLTLTGSGNINATGNNQANTLVGNAGNNVLTGGGGNDMLTGSGGSDSFKFGSALGGDNIDTITDYSVPNDGILLDDAVFTGLAPGVLSAGAFHTGAAAADASDRVIYNPATGALLFDADGLGGVAAVQFATLTAGLAMTNDEFLVI